MGCISAPELVAGSGGDGGGDMSMEEADGVRPIWACDANTPPAVALGAIRPEGEGGALVLCGLDEAWRMRGVREVAPYAVWGVVGADRAMGLGGIAPGRCGACVCIMLEASPSSRG